MTTIQTFLNNFVISLQTGSLVQLGYWSYLLLALLVAVEGPVITLLGAMAASAGLLRPTLVFLFAAIGNLAADSLWYLLGYKGKVEWLFRGGKRFGVKRVYIQRLTRGMQKHAVKILFFAKLSVSFVIPALVAAGLVKVPWRRWFPALLGAETLWTGSLVLIGFYTTEVLKRVERGIEYFIVVGSILFLGVLFWFGRHTLLRDSKVNINDESKDQKEE